MATLTIDVEGGWRGVRINGTEVAPTIGEIADILAAAGTGLTVSAHVCGEGEAPLTADECDVLWEMACYGGVLSLDGLGIFNRAAVRRAIEEGKGHD